MGTPSINSQSPSISRLCPALLQLSAMVRAAVEDNTLTIEPVASQTLPAAKVPTVEWNTTK